MAVELTVMAIFLISCWFSGLPSPAFRHFDIDAAAGCLVLIAKSGLIAGEKKEALQLLAWKVLSL